MCPAPTLAYAPPAPGPSAAAQSGSDATEQGRERHSRRTARRCYVVTIAVVRTLVSSVVLLVYGVLLEASVVIKALREPSAARPRPDRLIEATDIFLIGIALFVVGLGLYRLFVVETLPG